MKDQPTDLIAPPHKPRRARHQLRYKIALGLSALIFSLLLAEVLVRLLSPFQQLEFLPDDETLSAARPGQVTYHRRDDDGAIVPFISINRQGFRSTTDVPEKGNRRRVLLLGDSFTFGSGVEDGETFGAQLEELSEGRLEVINGASPGWGVFQMEIRLGRVIESLKPDFVVATIWQGDIVRQPFESAAEKEAFLRKARAKNTVRRVSKLALIAWRGFDEAKGALRNWWHKNEVKPQSEGSALASCWPSDQARLLKMKTVAQQHGATFLLVAWPKLGDLDTGFFLEEMARFGSEQGVLTVDLSDVLKKHDPGQWQIPNDGHANPFGHKIVAREIFDAAFQGALASATVPEAH